MVCDLADPVHCCGDFQELMHNSKNKPQNNVGHAQLQWLMLNTSMSFNCYTQVYALLYVYS